MTLRQAILASLCVFACTGEKGAEGPPGPAGPEAEFSAADVADAMLRDPVLRASVLENLAAGVADELASDPEFATQARGPQGEEGEMGPQGDQGPPGPAGPPGEPTAAQVATELASSPEFRGAVSEALAGDEGFAEELVGLLASDEQFQDSVTGPAGPAGDRGAVGPQGPEGPSVFPLMYDADGTFIGIVLSPDLALRPVADGWRYVSDGRDELIVYGAVNCEGQRYVQPDVTTDWRYIFRDSTFGESPYLHYEGGDAVNMRPVSWNNPNTNTCTPWGGDESLDHFPVEPVPGLDRQTAFEFGTAEVRIGPIPEP